VALSARRCARFGPVVVILYRCVGALPPAGLGPAGTLGQENRHPIINNEQMLTEIRAG